MWIQRVSWIGLTIALAGFVAGLGIHLATFAGINARLAVPEIVQAVNFFYFPAFAIAIALSLLGSRLKRRQINPLPRWLGITGLIFMLILFVYQMIHLVLVVWNPFNFDILRGADLQTQQIHSQSSAWMAVYLLVAVLFITRGLGYEFMFRFGKSAQPVGR